MATPDELVAANATALAAAQKTAELAYDATRHFGNMQQVAARGTAGALSLADTLAATPVGDKATVRSNIGAMSAGESLMTLPLGADAWQVRQRIGLGNDKDGRAALGITVAGAGDLMPVGYVGLGGYLAASVGNVMARVPTGVYAYAPGQAQPSDVSNNGLMLNLQHDARDWRVKMFFPTYSGRAFLSTYSNETWAPTGEIMIKGVSCTADSNGFLKVSSPILRIGAREDTITDHSFAPANYGATNGEAEGVTCERVSEGVYRVSGSLGFADDGAWTIETPRDDNNQPLLWVNTKQDADGTITVETYHRTHPDAPPFAQNNIDGKAPNDPIDVPAGRWIDLRLKMPEPVKVDEKSK